MSDLNDLLSAARNLNDPTTGVTPGWKKQLNTSTDKDVTARLGILESLDTALNTELVPTLSDVNELVILVEGYLQMTKGLYTFLLKFGNADKKTEKSVRD